MRYGLVRVPERLLTHANHTSVSAGNTSVSAGNTSVSAGNTSVSAGNTSVSAGNVAAFATYGSLILVPASPQGDGNTSVSVTCHTFTDLQARRAHTNLGSEASGESVSKEREAEEGEAEEGEAQEGEVCHNQEDAGVDCPDTQDHHISFDCRSINLQGL